MEWQCKFSSNGFRNVFQIDSRIILATVELVIESFGAELCDVGKLDFVAGIWRSFSSFSDDSGSELVELLSSVKKGSFDLWAFRRVWLIILDVSNPRKIFFGNEDMARWCTKV